MLRLLTPMMMAVHVLAMHPHVPSTRVPTPTFASLFSSSFLDAVVGGAPTGVGRCCVPGDSACENDPNHCSVGCVDGTLTGVSCKNCQCYTAGTGCCSKNYFCAGTIGVMDGACKPYCEVDPSTGAACYGNGKCSSTPGKCACNAGFDAKTSCKTCLPGFWGEDCTPCAGKGSNNDGCSGHGTCDGSGTTSGKGTCTCQMGWGSNDCSVCAKGMGPPGKCDTPICGIPCGNHGKCTHSSSGSSNTCTCAEGWSGATCDSPICTEDCGINGECVAPDKCSCAKGWSGDVCKTPVCDKVECTAHGTCTQPNVCTCKTGWTGGTCNDAICTPKCGIEGECTAPDTCTCKEGWTGSTCEMPICANGCNYGTCVAPGQCSCEEGWSGDDCMTPICEGTCGNGLCQKPGICKCNKGWAGAHCLVAQCGSIQCNTAHGSCTQPNECTCNKGWESPTCAVPVCKSTCNEAAKHGKCTGPDQCTCGKEWQGDACEEPVCDASCSAHGKCTSPGSCKCNDGFSGENCDVALSYWASTGKGLAHVITWGGVGLLALALPIFMCWWSKWSSCRCCSKTNKAPSDALKEPMLKNVVGNTEKTKKNGCRLLLDWMKIRMTTLVLLFLEVGLLAFLFWKVSPYTLSTAVTYCKAWLDAWNHGTLNAMYNKMVTSTFADIVIVWILRLLLTVLKAPWMVGCMSSTCCLRCLRCCCQRCRVCCVQCCVKPGLKCRQWRITEVMSLICSMAVLIMAGNKIFSYHINLVDSVGGFKAAVLVTFAVFCYAHVVADALVVRTMCRKKASEKCATAAAAAGAPITRNKSVPLHYPPPKFLPIETKDFAREAMKSLEISVPGKSVSFAYENVDENIDQKYPSATESGVEIEEKKDFTAEKQEFTAVKKEFTAVTVNDSGDDGTMSSLEARFKLLANDNSDSTHNVVRDVD